jgi:serine/threonine protein kinase
VIDLDQSLGAGDVYQGRFGIVEFFSETATGRKFIGKNCRHNDKMTGKSFLNGIKGLIALNHLCVVPIVGCVLPTRSQGPKTVIKFMGFGSLKLQMEKKNLEYSLIFDDTDMTIAIGGLVIGLRFVHSRHVIH